MSDTFKLYSLYADVQAHMALCWNKQLVHTLLIFEFSIYLFSLAWLPYIDLFTEFGRKVPGFITYYKLGQCTEFCPLLRFSSELFTQKDVWEESSCDWRG